MKWSVAVSELGDREITSTASGSAEQEKGFDYFKE